MHVQAQWGGAAGERYGSWEKAQLGRLWLVLRGQRGLEFGVSIHAFIRQWLTKCLPHVRLCVVDIRDEKTKTCPCLQVHPPKVDTHAQTTKGML